MRIKKVINESALNEETLEQAAAKEVGRAARVIGADEVVDWDGPYGEVEEALDTALKNAKRAAKHGRISGDNVLLVGRAGTGKTERIKEWARQRGIKIHFTDVQSLDPTDLAGIMGRDSDNPRYSNRLGNTEFHELDEPNTILFLDEVNRADMETLGALLTLVQNHTIVDPEAPGGKRRLKGMLFTVAAMNPYNPAYDVNDIDMAMRTRFGKINVEADNKFQEAFYEKFLGKELREAEEADDPEEIKIIRGQLELARTLMSSPLFRFDNDDEEADAKLEGEASLNPRTLTETLLACDGTKENFLKIYMQKCNPAKFDMVETILENYVDVDDKANDALKYGADNPFAQREKSVWDHIAGTF